MKIQKKARETLEVIVVDEKNIGFCRAAAWTVLGNAETIEVGDAVEYGPVGEIRGLIRRAELEANYERVPSAHRGRPKGAKNKQKDDAPQVEADPRQMTL